MACSWSQSSKTSNIYYNLIRVTNFGIKMTSHTTVPDLNILLIGADSDVGMSKEPSTAMGFGSTANMTLYSSPSSSFEHIHYASKDITASVVCFDIHDIQSYTEALQHVKELSATNQEKLLPIPIVLVGIVNPASQEKPPVSQKHSLHKLAQDKGLSGYYQVSAGVMKEIVENPQHFSDGNLFSTMSTGEAKSFNQDVRNAAMMYRQALSKLAHTLVKPLAALDKIKLSQHAALSEVKIKINQLQADYQKMVSLVENNCSKKDLLRFVGNLQQKINALDANLKDLKGHVMLKAKSIFSAPAECSQLESIRISLAQFSQVLSHLNIDPDSGRELHLPRMSLQ